MDAMGGKDNFTLKLDTLFDTDQYWHGNEPGHQTAYLYAYAGAPWKTQKHIKRIVEEIPFQLKIAQMRQFLLTNIFNLRKKKF